MRVIKISSLLFENLNLENKKNNYDYKKSENDKDSEIDFQSILDVETEKLIN